MVFTSEHVYVLFAFALLPVWGQISTKLSKFKLKQIYATKNTSMHLEHLNV
jgi:hypothetical protein